MPGWLAAESCLRRRDARGWITYWAGSWALETACVASTSDFGLPAACMSCPAKHRMSELVCLSSLMPHCAQPHPALPCSLLLQDAGYVVREMHQAVGEAAQQYEATGPGPMKAAGALPARCLLAGVLADAGLDRTGLDCSDAAAAAWQLLELCLGNWSMLFRDEFGRVGSFRRALQLQAVPTHVPLPPLLTCACACLVAPPGVQARESTWRTTLPACTWPACVPMCCILTRRLLTCLGTAHPSGRCCACWPRGGWVVGWVLAIAWA